MTILEIQNNLATTCAVETKPKKSTKKPAPAPKPKAQPVITSDEQLAWQAGRIVAALNLEKQGVTVDLLVAKVREFEHYEGPVQ